MWSEMSFKEKGVWGSLLLTISLPIYYWSELGDANGLSNADLWWHMGAFVTGFVVLIIILHIVVAALDTKDAERPDDERDRLIKLYGYRSGYFAFVFSLSLLFSLAFLLPDKNVIMLFPKASLAINLLHVCAILFVVSDLAKYVTQVFLYRRGLVYG